MMYCVFLGQNEKTNKFSLSETYKCFKMERLLLPPPLFSLLTPHQWQGKREDGCHYCASVWVCECDRDNHKKNNKMEELVLLVFE